MTRTLRAIWLALGLASLAAPAMAQTTCSPIPALPDATRRTEYLGVTSSTGPFSVNFQIYGDSTDYQNWIAVWVNGVLQASSTYTVTSPSGQLGLICRPITDAVVTFNAAITGTLEIEGARRPRRASQFSENRGVPAHDLNQVLTDMEAQLRERWDREGRLLRAPPGETLSVLPPAATRAGGLLGFDGLGQVIITNTSGLPISPASANTVFAGPATGSAAAPTFRHLLAADLPSIPWSLLISTPTTLAGYGITNARTQVSGPAYYVNGNSGSTATCGPAGASTCAAGSDSNDCLSPSTACLTSQHVMNLILAGVDFKGTSANIYLAHNAGTTNYAVTCTAGPLIGTSAILFTGDSSSPVATVIQAPANSAGAAVKDGCTLEFTYLVFADNATNNGTGGVTVSGAGNAGHVDIGNVQFNSFTVGTDIAAGNLDSVTAIGPIIFAGGTPLALSASNGGAIDFSGQSATVTNATVTITIAAPGVVTWTAHGLTAGSPVGFSTTGALPTGLTAGTIYYVTSDASLTANTFHVSDTSAHALAGTNTVTTTGSQSGTQTGMPGFSVAFAFMVNGGVIGATNTTFTGSAVGPKCQFDGPLNLGGYDPNGVFPGSVNCVNNTYVGAIGIQNGLTFNYGNAGDCIKSGGSASALNIFAACAGSGVPQNNLNTKTANYTIASTDCGKTIQAGTGSTGLFTVTLPSVSGFASNCVLAVYDGDTLRGKILSGFPVPLASAPNNMLWAGDTIQVGIVNGAWAVLSPAARHRIVASTTLFVDNTNGSDSNDCLATTTSACKTIQGAINYLQTWDGNAQAVTISVADGTYTNAVIINGPFNGNPTVTLQGDLATPANVLISTTSATALTVTNGATLTLGGFKIVTTTGGNGVVVQNASFLNITGAMEYGANANFQIQASASSTITISASYTISGSATRHWNSTNGSVIQPSGAITITISGTPAFSQFALAASGGVITTSGVTFSGSATGSQYLVTLQGVLNNSAALPGSAAGSVSSHGTVGVPGTPTITSCGTSPGAATGTDFSGHVTEGTTATGCTITFTTASTFSACTVSLSTGAAVGVSTLGATLVVTHASLSSNVLYWTCAN